jgi:hypothetical protein
MRSSSRLASVGLLGTIAVAGLAAVAAPGSSEEPNQPGGAFLQIGTHYIRVDHVDFVRVESDELVVSFTRGNILRLKGEDGRRLREWLDGQTPKSRPTGVAPPIASPPGIRGVPQAPS